MDRLNLLITGATGYLGSHLVKQLVTKHNIFIVKRSFDPINRIEPMLDQIECYDIDRIKIETIFEQNGIDGIIHTATLYGRNDEPLTDIVQSNLLFPITILDNAIRNKVKFFINCDTVLDRNTNTYSLSKKQLLDWLKFHQTKIEIINLKLEHFYGPDDHESKFITFMVKQMLNDEPQINLTKGEQKRDFIYIKDLVDFIDKIINTNFQLKKRFSEYHVGSGEIKPLKDIILKIKELTSSNTQLNFGAVPYRENELMNSGIDMDILYKLGWKPSVSLYEGIKKTIEFERTNLDKV